MRHDCVLIKLSFDLLTPGSRVGVVCRQNICDHVAAFVIPFNEIVLKKLNFDLLTPRVGGGGGGGGGGGIASKIFATMLLHFWADASIP